MLSAYKQGYLWMTEQVIPELKGKNARAVHVKVAEYHPDLSKKYKFYMVPSRWVHELYPVDEIFQRELGHRRRTRSRSSSSTTRRTSTRVEATDAAGKVVYTPAFIAEDRRARVSRQVPRLVARRSSRPAGCRRRSTASRSSTQRIATDPERFWDHYQSKVLPRIYDNVMKVTDNRPLPDKQPFHRDLDIEVWMSEPDFRIGVDEELISSLEALHEDLYFVTLDFFDALGRTTTQAAAGRARQDLSDHSSRSRRASRGRSRVHYAGNASPKPKLEIAYKEKGVERPTRVSRELTRIDATPAAGRSASWCAPIASARSSSTSRRRTIAKRRARPTRSTRSRACTRPGSIATRCRSITSTAWR